LLSISADRRVHKERGRRQSTMPLFSVGQMSSFEGQKKKEQALKGSSEQGEGSPVSTMVE